MSFGVAIGDFVAIGTLAWNIYRSCKGMRAEFEEVGREALAAHTVMKELEYEVNDHQSALNRCHLTKRQELIQLVEGLRTTLQNFDNIIIKYKGFTRRERRVWDQLRFAAINLSAPREQLTLHLTAINAFMDGVSRGTLARLETVLLELVREVREGRRAPTVVSIDQPQDTSGWKELELELAEDGITASDVADHKVAIRAFLLGRLKDSTTDDLSFYEVASAIVTSKYKGTMADDMSFLTLESAQNSIGFEDSGHARNSEDPAASQQSFKTAREHIFEEMESMPATEARRISFAPFTRIPKDSLPDLSAPSKPNKLLRRLSISKTSDKHILRHKSSLESVLFDTLIPKPQRVLIVDPIHSSFSKLMHAYLRSLTKTHPTVGQRIDAVRSTGWRMHESGGMEMYPVDNMIRELLLSKRIELPSSDTYMIKEFRFADVLQFDHIIYLDSPSFTEYLEANIQKIAKAKAKEEFEGAQFAKLTRYDRPSALYLPESMSKGIGFAAGMFSYRQKLALEEILRTAQRCVHEFLEREFGLRKSGQGFEKTLSKRPSKASLLSHSDDRRRSASPEGKG
ncbi:uncharacterized protein KY384_000840 [Bacidia gigantensis]|uniref:uncharacterized protein n=1 Tax=Bacidia gigantensis TaxID=2732470 RepID=UPI001D04B0C1|nr:uncharacterized protein KY384_000840 [Bacidia gigantensis]KAG8533998.1 hypothetical protein KY384_000840 [Bacidia gigantensis]